MNHFCWWKITIVLTRNMRKQMNKALLWEGGDVFFVGQQRHFRWIEKALLPCTWKNNKKSKSTLKNENQKYELTSEFIWWNDWLWL
jgi:hypothetical protein